MKISKATRIFSRFYIYFLLVIMYLPIIVLIAFSFTNTRIIGNWNGFSMKLYADLFRDKEIMGAFLNTFSIAVCSALVSTVIGTLGAIGIFYSKKRTKTIMDIVGNIPIMNAEIVTALSLTVLFVFCHITFNFSTLLAGHVVLTIPFVVLSVRPKLVQMDANIYEAALDLGATPRKALRKIVLPEIFPGILSGFILSVTLSLDDYIITAFTRDTSYQTLSTYVYGITSKKGSLPPRLRALTAVITVIALAVLVIVNFQSKPKGEEKRR